MVKQTNGLRDPVTENIIRKADDKDMIRRLLAENIVLCRAAGSLDGAAVLDEVAALQNLSMKQLRGRVREERKTWNDVSERLRILKELSDLRRAIEQSVLRAIRFLDVWRARSKDFMAVEAFLSSRELPGKAKRPNKEQAP